jgi:hypothetical protein
VRPSQIRAQVLDDHLAIRGMLLGLEDLANAVLGGRRELLRPLRLEGVSLLERLDRHMYWEDVHLAPALRRADAWGEERAEHLDRDHAEQRELLTHALERVEDPTRPAELLARNLLDLVALLREDMEDEERSLLDERVLRDDVVGIDVETG